MRQSPFSILKCGDTTTENEDGFRFSGLVLPSLFSLRPDISLSDCAQHSSAGHWSHLTGVSCDIFLQLDALQLVALPLN